MQQAAILEAFADLPDQRRRQGRRHSLPLCLALFTLAVAAGNQGFLAIGDWLKSYCEQLSELFGVEEHCLPSYSTIRRTLLSIEYQDYAASLAKFFNICPEAGETIAVDGKVAKGSFMVEKDNPNCESHPAIMLVSAYLVERGLILQLYEVDRKTNEIKALPELIKNLALKGVVFTFDAMNTQKKTCQLIVESENDYIGALKGNQPGLLKEVKANFTSAETTQQLNKGHGRIEKRTVSICRTLEDIRAWPGLRTIIRVESERQIIKGELLIGSKQVHYYISSLTESVQQIAQRVRGYWGVENRVHYVRDVTQGEDASRIRTTPLVQLWALARNFALNSYRAFGFKNIAQAYRKCAFGLDILKTLFRMK